jgi:hypothetical protein
LKRTEVRIDKRSRTKMPFPPEFTLANPEHEEYEFAIEQIGKDFDPVEVDILAINDALTHLASKWDPQASPKAEPNPLSSLNRQRGYPEAL